VAGLCVDVADLHEFPVNFMRSGFAV